jgi:hypothetical protein
LRPGIDIGIATLQIMRAAFWSKRGLSNMRGLSSELKS